MLNRFAFRQFCMADSGAGEGVANVEKSRFPASLVNPSSKGTTSAKNPPDNRIIQGGSEHKLLLLLKRHKGEMTVEQLAPLVETRSGIGTEVDTLRSQISKLRGKLERMNMPQEQIDALMPKDYGTGGRGRRAGVGIDTKDLAALLAADADELFGDKNE